MSKNLYIVPYDFSPVSEKAVEYALFLGRHVATEIQLVQIILVVLQAIMTEMFG